MLSTLGNIFRRKAKAHPLPVSKPTKVCKDPSMEEDLEMIYPEAAIKRISQTPRNYKIEAPSGLTEEDKAEFHGHISTIKPLFNRGFSHRLMFCQMMQALGFNREVVSAGFARLQGLSYNSGYKLRFLAVYYGLIFTHGIIFPMVATHRHEYDTDPLLAKRV